MTVFYDWSKTCTWHGIPDFANAQYFRRKCVWAFISICCTSVLIWQLVSLVGAYINEVHYVTSITTQLLTAVPFPNVTVCNYNRVNLTRAKQLNLSENNLAYMYLALPQNYKMNTSKLLTLNEQLRLSYESWKSTYNGSLSVPHMFDQLGHDCNETFILCTFGTSMFNCCPSATVINQYGKCYSIKPTANDKQHSEGPEGALGLVMDPNIDLYSNIVFNDLISSGTVLIISNEPETYLVEDPINLEPGKMAYVSISATKSFLTPPPFPMWPYPCRTGAKLKYLPGSYTRGKCTYECFVKEVVSNCGCGFLSELSNLSPCTFDNISCVSDIWYGFTPPFTSAESQRMLQCSTNECPVPCEERLTFSSRTTTTIPTPMQEYKSKIALVNQEVITANADTSTFIQVSVYYGALELTVRETTEKTSIFSLISNFGGQLGLWAGMSVISIIQVFVFLWDLLKFARSRCRQKLHIGGIDVSLETDNEISIG